MPFNMQQVLNIKQRWLCLIAISVITASCTKVNINYGNQTITDPNVVYIDSFTYNLTTFQKDSFVTSGTSNLMVGIQNDTAFGKMTSESYFQLGAPGYNTISFPLIAILDSAKLRLKRSPTSAYYGDTTSTFSFGLYQLTQQIALGDGQNAFYNTSSFAAQSTPLTTFSTTIRPFFTDSILAPLDITPGGFAADLFTKLKTNATQIQNDVQFLAYKPGFVIKPLSNTNAVFSFSGAIDTGLTVRFYYHFSNPNPVNTFVDFKLTNSSNQFNHITVDRTNTPLKAFTPNIPQYLASTATNNRAYLQTAGNLQLKIDFPGLRALREERRYKKILSAVLYIEPYGYRSNGIYKLPSTLNLQIADPNNSSLGAVVDNLTGSIQVVPPVIDNLSGAYPYYAFDITRYVTNIMNGGTDNFSGLTLQSPAYSTNTSVDRLVLVNPKLNTTLYKSVQIKLYALTF